tara:strand:+ start:1650 stop:2312 length:663 start_codon:yes stop_codon:yes gene_type:complete
MSKATYTCPTCDKEYKSRITLDKHQKKCNVSQESSTNGNDNTEKSYNVNMYFNKTNVDVEVTDVDTNEVIEKTTRPLKQRQSQIPPQVEVTDDETLDEMLRPRVSETYQREITNLKNLIKHIGDLNIPSGDEERVTTIIMLKTTSDMLLKQSLKLMEEMEQIAKKNSFLKNNMMMASFLLEKCRTDEEFLETIKDYDEKDRRKAEKQKEEQEHKEKQEQE